MHPFLGTLALTPVEKLVNQLLALDPHVARSLKTFEGKTLEIAGRGPSLVLTIRIQNGRVRFSALTAGTLGMQPDATISGNTGDLLNILLNPDSQPLANRKMNITGDALFVQEVVASLSRLDIDWRDYLPPVLRDLGGDIVAQELGELSQQVQQWSQQARVNLQRSVGEYVREEIRLVPDRALVDAFSDQLDKVKLALDRAMARAGMLEERLDKLLKNQHLSD